MPSDIFGLGLVYETQVESTWPELSEFGYFAGGVDLLVPAVVSTIDRLDFSNETVSAPTGNDLTQARISLTAVSNSNYGYFAGGSEPGPIRVCTINRLDFSNETVTAPGNNLTQATQGLAAVSNSNYGYFAGGEVPGTPGNTCIIDRLDFSNETVVAPGNNLPQARFGLAAVSNSNYGYFAGGQDTPTLICTIDRLDFSNETISNSPANLSKGRAQLAAVSNSNYGYFGGGLDFSTPPTLSTIDRLDFSNDTVLSPGTYQLTQERNNLAAVSNSNYGYFGGGGARSTIDRLDFSNETVSAPGNNLTQARAYLSGLSTKPTTETARKVRRGEFDASGLVYSNYGYFGGGYLPFGQPEVSTTDRLDFATETVSAPPSIHLTEARRELAAVSNSNYGYFGGGIDPSINVCTIDRLDFATETVLNPNPGAYQLTQARRNLAAVSNSNYGYFAGGFNPPNVCTIDRLDFSNETVDVPGTLGQLTDAREGLAAVSNSNYGYFGGGSTPGSVCTIDRLDFSSETVVASGNNLTEARRELAAVSNSNYGYFAGGRSLNPTPPTLGPHVCTIDRLDFSNETVDVPGTLGQLTGARSLLAGVSNSNYGYFAGGESPIVSTIDRLDFSNETIQFPVTVEQLTQARRSLAGTNIPLNQTRHVAPQAVVGVSTFFFSYGKPENTVSYGFGYFGGGSPSLSTIDRLDFSTEIVTGPSDHGMNLTQARFGLAAVSNSNYGYFGGGAGTITVDRLDFANETVTGPPVHGINLTQGRSYLAAVSSPRGYGYFAGGDAPSIPDSVCTIDRLDFSSETLDVPGTLDQLGQKRQFIASLSSPEYGYFAGGGDPGPPSTSRVDRLDFFNETVTGPPDHGINLPTARFGLAGVSNSNYGYFGGGVGPGYTCIIDRLDFSNQTMSNPPVSLTKARYRLAAVSSPNYGYFAGGVFVPGPVVHSTIDRLDFSNETVAAPTGYYLTQAREQLAGTQVNYYQKVGRPISKAYGYFAGGFGPGGYYSAIDRLDFSNETVSAPGNNLTQGRSFLAAVSNSNYGYFAGGQAPGATQVCTIDRLDFSNETVAAPGISPGQLTQARQGLAAVSNSNYGYFGGGLDQSVPTSACTIDRLDFSTETVLNPNPGAYQLTQARYRLAAVSNSNYGYFAGGVFPIVSTIDRLDFSTETVDGPTTLPPQCRLTQARYQLAAVSNSNYGYFGGGTPPNVCTIDRLDFSNETVDVPGTLGQLTQARQGLAAVSSSSYGYFGGGSQNPPNVCTIDRLDFSNETVSAPGTYQLTDARADLAAVSN